MFQALDLDEPRALRLLQSAEIDLRAAVRSDPNGIRAWIVLGQMAHAGADFTAAYWATRRAYELDTFNDHSQELLVTLFDAAYELGDDVGAERWCRELRQLFPGSSTGAYCKLAARARGDRHAAEDVARAWAAIRDLNAPRSASTVIPRMEMMVASILAGAGLRDSSDAVIRRARERGEPDPELLHLEAHARLLLGQTDSASVLLSAYVSADPGRRTHVLKSRRFQALATPAERSPQPPVADRAIPMP